MNQVQLKEKILITIKKLGINGEGVGYYKRQAIFVDGALPQEEVEVEITEIKDKYAYGEITKIKKKSPYRIEPKCKYYGKCGGCQLQHLDYNQSLIEKSNMVIDSFNRYYDGNLDKVDIYPTLGMENPWNYRNKSSLPVRHDGEKVVSGLYHKNTNKLVYIDECLIESKLVGKIVSETLNILTEEQVDIYNPKFKHGVLRYVIVRAFEDTLEAQITLIVNKEDKKIQKAMKKLLTIDNVKSVNYSINDDLKSVEIFGKEVINFCGNKEIKGNLSGLKFLISPIAFFQLNSIQTEVLYNEVKKACKLTGKEKLLDCYCGIGSIGMYLAKNALEVRGIDISKQGIDNANKFAQLNKIKNAKFYYGNIIPHLHDFQKEDFNADVLVVDPPRKGLDLNFINYIKKSKIKRIVYVSCNPSTLAKNVNHLQKEYIIRYIQPVDMFPWTANVECVVCLERR